jgi:hypothetical protein
MKLRLLTAATAALALAAPAAASAAELSVSPAKRCYGTGEQVSLTGIGFSPSAEIAITRDGQPLGPNSSAFTDASGVFSGTLTLGQERGKRTSTYLATDTVNPALTASMQLTVSAVNVRVRPKNGPPSRLMTINATGFTLGKTLWAHVVKGRSKRHLKIGRLRKACHVIEAKRRLLRQGAAVGVYTVQFDTFKRYKAERTQQVEFTLAVSRVFRPAIASASWSRLF